jgi:hypothetical protein
MRSPTLFFWAALIMQTCKERARGGLAVLLWVRFFLNAPSSVHTLIEDLGCEAIWQGPGRYPPLLYPVSATHCGPRVLRS